jgi:hypothetical protein
MNTLSSAFSPPSSVLRPPTSDLSPPPFAVLYLDDLTTAEFETRKEWHQAKLAAMRVLRPFILLSFRERAGRKIWMPQETHYLSNV